MEVTADTTDFRRVAHTEGPEIGDENTLPCDIKHRAAAVFSCQVSKIENPAR